MVQQISIMANEIVPVILFLMSCLPGEILGLDECRAKTYEEPGDVKFSLIVSMRANAGQGTCGDVAYGSLQYLLAVKYVLQKLNTKDKDGHTFVPGVKLGFEVYDDCGNEEYATAHALEAIRVYYPESIMDCSSSNQSSMFAGIIGPSRSQSTTAVSELTHNTGIPLVTMAATLSELSDKDKYPNVLRTTVSDEIQSRAIVSLLKRLKWSVVSIIHTGDNYGTDLAGSLQELAKREQICVIHVDKIKSESADVYRVIDNLLLKQKQTTGESMGVLYVGQRDTARLLISSVQLRLQNALPAIQISLQNLKWVMSDSVGTNAEILDDFDNFVLTVSPTSIELPEFAQFVQSEINRVKSNSNNETISWLVDYVKKACTSKTFPGVGCEAFEQYDYATATIDAVYALSAAVKSAHLQMCRGVPGACAAFRNEKTLGLLKYVKNVSVQYTALDDRHAVPEFSAIGRNLAFDTNGDMVHSEGLDRFTFQRYNSRTFNKVGSFNTNGTSLDPTFDQENHESSCDRACGTCAEKPSFVYRPGKVLVVGFYSMHWAPDIDNPFGCGEFRSVEHTVIAVEAFQYMVRKLSLDTGLEIGYVIFDDCYNNLKADLYVSKYFSGETPLIDPKTGKAVDLSKVLAIIGAESSSVTIPLAASFARLRLPVVSPASTSPDLDDRGLYPYFLRTVPSEKDTGDVMVAVMKNFGWAYVNIIYVNNNYGYKAMLKVKEKAKQERICVAEPISMDVSPEEKDLITIIKQLYENGARVVIFIGIEEDAKRFQRVITDNGIDLLFLSLEDWAVSLKPLPGTERAIAGSLVFNTETPHTQPNDFPEYMQNRVPDLNETSLWFDAFWQSHFKCNLPGRFENTFSKVCDLSTQRFDKATTETWRGHFRIGNTINAVAAVITGAIKARGILCQLNEVFACKRYRENPKLVTQYIREITLGTGSDSFRPFRDDGNGNAGIRIYNLQRQVDGSYEYIEVGAYDLVRNELTLAEDRTEFYRKGIPIKDVKAICTVQEICESCQSALDLATSTSGHSLFDGVTAGAVNVAILVLVSIICVLAIIAFVLFVCRRMRTRDSSQSNGKRFLSTKAPVVFTRSPVNDNTQPRSLSGPHFQNPPPNYLSPAISRLNSLEFTGYDCLESTDNRENDGEGRRQSPRPVLDDIATYRDPASTPNYLDQNGHHSDYEPVISSSNPRHDSMGDRSGDANMAGSGTVSEDYMEARHLTAEQAADGYMTAIHSLTSMKAESPNKAQWSNHQDRSIGHETSNPRPQDLPLRHNLSDTQQLEDSTEQGEDYV